MATADCGKEKARPSARYFEHKGFYFSSYFDRQKVENDALRTFLWEEGDVVVCGFPKSGTTWLCYLLQNMKDFGVVHSSERSEALMLDWFLINTGNARTDIRGTLARRFQDGQLDISSPRLMKTHLPLPVFPMEESQRKNVKIIYISRNPKDVVVSTYHFYQVVYGGFYAKDWKPSLESFVSGEMVYGPWLQHVIQWKKLSLQDNVLQVNYEEMKTDLPQIIRQLAKFLEIGLCDEAVSKIATACSAEEMKKCVHKYFIMDKGVLDDETKFIRKGVVGDWKNQFLVAQSEQFDEEIGAKLEENGLKFKYELP